MTQENNVQTVNSLPLTLAERTFGKVSHVTESRTGVLTRKMPTAKKWKEAYKKQNPGATSNEMRKAYNEDLLLLAKENATLMNAKVASGELVATRTSFNPKTKGWSTTYVDAAKLIAKIERMGEEGKAIRAMEDAKKLLEGVQIQDERVLKALKIMGIQK